MKSPCSIDFSRSAILMLVLALAIALLPSPGMGQTYSAPVTLYTFSGPDGQYPAAPLTPDGQGNFYGATALGGPSFSFLNGGNDAFGTIFKYSTATNTLTTLASFDGLNGFKPETSITIDSQGNIWGTTYEGGVDWNPPINHFGWGTVWEYSAAGLFVPGIAEFSGPDGANAFGNLRWTHRGISGAQRIKAVLDGIPVWVPSPMGRCFSFRLVSYGRARRCLSHQQYLCPARSSIAWAMSLASCPTAA